MATNIDDKIETDRLRDEVVRKMITMPPLPKKPVHEMKPKKLANGDQKTSNEEFKV